MRSVWIYAHLALIGLFGGAPRPAHPQAAAAQDGVEFFEKRIRPVLVDKCYKCHSGKSDKVKADLYVDTRDGLLKGGESGPAIVPGDPDKSLLIKAIRYIDEDLEMPPKEADRLTLEQVRDFEVWVKMGAPDPRTADAVAAPPKPAIDFAKARGFWSLRPVTDPPLPAVKQKNWPKNPIDRFVLARLEAKGLRPVADADPRTLVRRATYDLIGLPPTPEEVEAFVADRSPEALSKLVDRLLASPRYGERWGRHWMDVIRYSDTAGCNSDYPIPQMFKYRNWIIKAFNDDKPYDQFVREQLAGDLLPYSSEPDKHRKIIATGYLANSRRFASSEAGTQHLIIEDTIDNVGRTFLGLTVNCARCHDHKFDAISNEDYYALYGIFQSTRYPFPGIELNKVPRDLVPLLPAEKVEEILKPYKERLASLDGVVKKLEAEQTALRKVTTDADDALSAIKFRRAKEAGEARKAEEARRALEAKELEEARARTKSDVADPETRRKLDEADAALAQARRARAFAESEVRRLEAERAGIVKAAADAEELRKVTDLENHAADARKRLDELKNLLKDARARYQEFAKQMPLVESAYAVAEGAKAENAKLHIRGEPKNLGPEVPRRFLEVLGGRKAEPGGSGRRDLAEWLGDLRNPLVARVLVNRLWHWHFGKGIVQTPSDFGVRGMPPTHPELLDYLAARFVEGGGSIKAMHRLIMNSRAYRLASSGLPGQATADPNNDLLWKFSRRRLEAEAIRDAVLAVSGSIDLEPGGAHPFTPQNTWDYTQHRPFVAVYETNKRSVYVMTQRIKRHPFFSLFDGPDTNASTALRGTSTTSLQALFMMNDPFVHREAKRFGQRLLESKPDDSGRIELGYLLAFGRPPTSEERQAGLDFLARVGARLGASESQAPLAWESYARVLLRTNEFIFVD